MPWCRGYPGAVIGLVLGAGAVALCSFQNLILAERTGPQARRFSDPWATQGSAEPSGSDSGEHLMVRLVIVTRSDRNVERSPCLYSRENADEVIPSSHSIVLLSQMPRAMNRWPYTNGPQSHVESQQRPAPREPASARRNRRR